ncbi:hypothetical protein DCAR_0935011 [Daucus carota subsp. sativus]|uniref:HTH myb-type domain-containing protein n=1 Tax=Daucus carota subsp. sativus TaxID=79200 RepID=A0AAF1BDK1_DAUCS|nr:PREDICTED: two-component response regulator ARR1-like [Daucus carota subsp. sativus]WOH15470.1 hypothetical protein DCAR_0935011 [Daucus carota subsp. sativus]
MTVNENRNPGTSSLHYIECLEDERRKIQVFHRELPLCLDLVSQAIETCRKEMSDSGKSESFEQESKGRPVFEEFIPMKNASFFSPEDEQRKFNDRGKNVVSDDDCNNENSTKSDWLKSVQLWQHTPDQDQSNDKDLVREVSITRSRSNGSGGGFQPFNKDKRVGSNAREPVTTPNVNSTAASGSRGGGSSKPRRNWSPELHRRFLVALEELGGAHVATPKQIMQKMKVDGLTNNEVKSHLQKYRLHERPSSSSSTQETQTQSAVLPPPQTAPQFVILGGLWVPPPEYAVARTLQLGDGTETTMPHSPSMEIYAPRPLRAQPPEDEATPLLKKRKRSIEFQSADSTRCYQKGRNGSDSSATSSSTHTTTASRIA